MLVWLKPTRLSFIPPTRLFGSVGLTAMSSSACRRNVQSWLTRPFWPWLRSAQPTDLTVIPGLRLSSGAAGRALDADDLSRIAATRLGERNGICLTPPLTCITAGRNVPARIRCGTLGAAVDDPACT